MKQLKTGTVVNGSTFVPVRFIAESLGAEVDWNNETQTVIINSNIKNYKVTKVVDVDKSLTPTNQCIYLKHIPQDLYPW